MAPAGSPRFWPLLLAMGLAPAGCAELWAPLGGDYAESEAPRPPASVTPAGPEPPRVVLTGSIEQRYPFVRFVRHGDDEYTAYATLPNGAGATMLPELVALVNCDDRAERPAEITIKAGQGAAFLGPLVTDPAKAAVGANGNMTAVEDILVVRGSERDIDEVFQALDLFYNGGPQIEIQAQIVEVTDSRLLERGIAPVNSSTPLIRNNGAIGPNGEGPFLRAIGGSFPTPTGQNLAGTAGSGLVGQISLLQNQLQLQALIQLLESTDGVDIVSRPRVVVRNGVTADLTSSERVPYLKATTFSAQGVTQSTLDYQNVGVGLNVLPFLMGSDTVHMVIEASVSRLGRNVLISTDVEGNPFFSPSINTREARTAVSVRSGQPVVIGGLKLKETRETQNKVPFLGDLPVFEYLFSSDTQQEVETEVLFIITPIVKTRGVSISPFGDIFDPFGGGSTD